MSGKTVLCLGAFTLHAYDRGFHKELKTVPLRRQDKEPFVSESVAIGTQKPSAEMMSTVLEQMIGEEGSGRSRDGARANAPGVPAGLQPGKPYHPKDMMNSMV